MIDGIIFHMKDGSTIKAASDGSNPGYHDLLSWMSTPEKSCFSPVEIAEIGGDDYLIQVADISFIEPSENILDEDELEDNGLADLDQEPWNSPENFDEHEYTMKIMLSETMRRW